MAGTASTLLIILMTICVGLMFFGFDTGSTALIKIININILHQTVEVSSDYQQILKDMFMGAGILSLVSAGIVGLLAGRENGLYAGLATFLVQFALVPISLLTMASIPFMVRMIFGVPLILAFIFAIVGFFRGYEP